MPADLRMNCNARRSRDDREGRRARAHSLARSLTASRQSQSNAANRHCCAVAGGPHRVMQHSTQCSMATHGFANVLFEPAALPDIVVTPAAEDDWLGSEAPLVVCVCEDALGDGGDAAAGGAVTLSEASLAALDAASQGALSAALQLGGFRGKKSELSPPVVIASGGRPQMLLLLGLGKSSTLAAAGRAWGPDAFHAAGTALAAAAKSYKLRGMQVVLHLGLNQLQQQHQQQRAAAAAAVTSLTAGLLVGLYECVRYKSKPESRAQLSRVALLVPPSADVAALADAAARGKALATGTLTARFLVEAPANVCTPSHLAAAAAHIAALDPAHFQLVVLEEAQCRELGLGLYVGVAAGSDEPLKLIHLTYTPDGPISRKVALVGKGLTFDTGGYNLKTSGGIETMKCDMGGAAAVLGAARALRDLRPQGVQVHFITAACENMVSGRATRPSDIHISAAGKTIEVNDTDAEGRLTLADALWYAQRAGAEVVVDIATLTGAAGIALGQDTGALFANCDALAADVDAASRAAGEKLWRMPLNEGLKCKLESPIADFRNYAGRFGGAITAALFLQEFIDNGSQWCHLDVAGPAWDDAAGLPTGFGAATLAELVLLLDKQQQQA